MLKKVYAVLVILSHLFIYLFVSQLNKDIGLANLCLVPITTTMPPPFASSSLITSNIWKFQK